MQGRDPGAPVLMSVGKLPRELSGDGFEFAARLLYAYAGFKPRDDFDPTLAAVSVLRRQVERRPHFHFAIWKMKPRRRNPNDSVTGAVERERASDHIRIGAVASLPETMAEDHDVRGAGRGIFRQKRPTLQHTDAERLKKIWRSDDARDLFRLVFLRDVEPIRPPRGDLGGAR